MTAYEALAFVSIDKLAALFMLFFILGVTLPWGYITYFSKLASILFCMLAFAQLVNRFYILLGG
jgi:hypothetical protein